jgi:Na+-driven multidrug efflux pump
MDPNGLAVRIFLERQRFRKIELPASSAPIIVWFREDFRLSDNPAVHAAAKQGRPIICLYIHMDGGMASVVSAALRVGGSTSPSKRSRAISNSWVDS